MRIEVKSDNITFTSFQRPGGVTLSTQEVSCREKCVVSKKICALKHDPGSVAIMKRFEAEIKDATTDKARRKVWARYFFDGAGVKDGDVLIAEAILGNQRANELVRNVPGADAGLGGAAGEILLKIVEQQKICAPVRK